LLLGETGTGKTTLANALHRLSPRAAGPFIPLNLAAEPEALAASAILGHQRGAFTGAHDERQGAFERADGGTIFIDEIDKASLATQACLLRVLESREVTRLGDHRKRSADCRVIVASNAQLADRVRRGTFLDDLLARIEGFDITVPPLRERREDIPQLADRFLTAHWRRHQMSYRRPQIAPQLMDRLVAAEWRHNLRQLDRVIHRLYLLADGDPEISVAHCDESMEFLNPQARTLASYSLEELEELLKHHRFASDAADALGVHRGSFHRRLKQLRDAKSSASGRSTAPAGPSDTV
jgi:DNA-binding NtrC family response regulator